MFRYAWNARGDDARRPIEKQHAMLVAKFTAAMEAGVRFGSNGQPLKWDPVTFPGVGHDGQRTEYTYHKQPKDDVGHDSIDEHFLLWEAASQAGCRFGDDGLPLGWNPRQVQGMSLRDREPTQFTYHHQFRNGPAGTVKSDLATAAGENKRLIHEAAKEAGLEFDTDGDVRSFQYSEYFHDSNVVDIEAAATDDADVQRSAAATDDTDGAAAVAPIADDDGELTEQPTTRQRIT